MLEVDFQILGLNLPQRVLLAGASRAVGWDLPERREMVGAHCGGREGGQVGVQRLGWTGDGWTVLAGRR